MLDGDVAADIEAAIEDIRMLGHAIASAVEGAQTLVDRRLAAIRRLHELADRHVMLADQDTAIATMASSRTPPLLVDMVLLAVLEAGDNGATVAHVHSTLRHRYGRTMDATAVSGALRLLASEGRVLDRGTMFFAPASDLARLTGTRATATIKALIVEALENGPVQGLPPPSIRDAIAVVHRRRIPMTSLYPVIRQLDRAGRVAKRGRDWHLLDRSAAPPQKEEDGAQPS